MFAFSLFIFSSFSFKAAPAQPRRELLENRDQMKWIHFEFWLKFVEVGQRLPVIPGLSGYNSSTTFCEAVVSRHSSGKHFCYYLENLNSNRCRNKIPADPEFQIPFKLSA